MRYYIGLVHKDPNSDFGLSFPGFPGCISAGSTLDEAVSLGRAALEGHVELMAEGGEAIPEATSMEVILADPDNRSGTPVLIPFSPTSSKTVRANITMPEAVLRGIDAYAETHGFTRSGFLVTAAKRAMQGA